MTFPLEYECNLSNPELKMRILERTSRRRGRERNIFGRWSTPYPLEAVLLTLGVWFNLVQFTLSVNHLQSAVPGARDAETKATQPLLLGIQARGRDDNADK